MSQADSSPCASLSRPDPRNPPHSGAAPGLRSPLLKGGGTVCSCDDPGQPHWKSRMAALTRVLSFLLLLGLLLAFSPEALGVNPGLVARITAKGLEYGKKLWPSAGLADLLGLALDCSGYYSGGPDWAPSLRQPWLGLCATWALTCLSWVPTSQQRQRFGCK